MKNSRYPFVVIFILFALAVMLFRHVSVLVAVTMFILGLIIYLSFSNARMKNIVMLLMIFAGLLIYTKSYQMPYKKDIAREARYYRNKPIELIGVVVSDVQQRNTDNRKKTTFELKVKSVKTPWGFKKRNGKLLVNVFRYVDIKFADRIQLSGSIHRPFNFGEDSNFSYRKFLANKSIYYILSVKRDAPIEIIERGDGSLVMQSAYRLRHRLKSILSAHLSKNESGIMQAILLGDRTHLPGHVRELFVRTGTAHILAISGLHIGVVAGLLYLFMRILPISRQAQLICVVILLLGYALMTGMRPSVLRATIMASTLLFSLVLEKQSYVFNTLSFSAVIILFINPLNLFDIGFQLSYTCVFSILLIAPFINGALSKTFKQWPAALIDLVGVSMAVWIGVLGMIAYYFQVITPITILANVFVVPLIGVVVSLGVALLIVGMLGIAVVGPFAICLQLALNVLVAIIYLLDKLPGSYYSITTINSIHVAIYYAVLILTICLLHRVRLSNRPMKNVF